MPNRAGIPSQAFLAAGKASSSATACAPRFAWRLSFTSSGVEPDDMRPNHIRTFAAISTAIARPMRFTPHPPPRFRHRGPALRSGPTSALARTDRAASTYRWLRRPKPLAVRPQPGGFGHWFAHGEPSCPHREVAAAASAAPAALPAWYRQHPPDCDCQSRRTRQSVVQLRTGPYGLIPSVTDRSACGYIGSE
jgi:hypothetical protein